MWFEIPAAASRGAPLMAVHEASGVRLDLGGSPVDEAGPVHLGVAPAESMPAGRYEVSWRALTREGETVVGSYTFGAGNTGDEDDDRVLVALATFGAAVTAVLVGSAGYLLRRRLGLIKPPPTQGPEH